MSMNISVDSSNIFVKDCFTNWKPVIRWIALVPAAFLIFFVGMIFGKYAIAVSLAFGGIDILGSDIVSAMTDILTEIVSIIALVVVAHDIAPRLKKEVGLAFSGVIGLIGIYGLVLLAVVWGDITLYDKVYSTVVYATALITASWLICFLIKHQPETESLS
jgi:hypothetical protein